MSAEGWLSADAEAYIGEDYLVSFHALPEDARNITIRVYGTGEAVTWRFFDDGTRFATLRVPVAWSWGSAGYVQLRFDNATGAFEEQRSFRVFCPAQCMADVINAAVAGLAAQYLLFTAASVLVAFALAAHASIVYANRAGIPPWTDGVALALRSRVRRDPIARAKEDPLGLLPPAARAELQGLATAIAKAEELRRNAHRAWRLLDRGARKLPKDDPALADQSPLPPPQEDKS